MAEPISTIVSIVALTISAATAYLTLFRKGTVRITRPSVIYFGPDGGRNSERLSKPKVFLRSLIYSTSKRGHIIETMFVTLRRGETRQTFNIWVYGDDELKRGSGLFVSESGVACNHHFLLPSDGTNFEFLAGEYQLDVFASLVGAKVDLHLSSVKLAVSEAHTAQLRDPNSGLYFDWGPDSKAYHAKLDRRSH